MAQRKIKGNETLAKRIKERRNELGLTIEEAASRAKVGIKTWCRYEAGGSVRGDKCKGVCKALNWNGFPDSDDGTEEGISLWEYKKHNAWSRFLEDTFGTEAAVAFAAGSDILLDYIKEDMAELSSMPAGTHIGQLSVSRLSDELPKQFLMRYDYEFLYKLKCGLKKMREQAKAGLPMTAHSVIEELLFYLCCEEASVLFELGVIDGIENDDDENYEEWVFDLFGDMDIISCLYSDIVLDSDHLYHFSHWTDEQFYVS